MGKVAMIGTISCVEGKADEMASVLARMVDAAHHEPGCEIYSYHRAPDDTFHFFALMESEEAMQNHGQSQQMQAAMQDFMPLMASPPQVTPATPVGAIGLDL